MCRLHYAQTDSISPIIGMEAMHNWLIANVLYGTDNMIITHLTI